MALSSPVWITITLDTLVAIGTLAVAVAAIWGDWLRAKFAAPRLRIEMMDPAGELTVFDTDKPVVRYHIKVINARPWVTVQNCRLMLVGLSRKGPDHQFRPEPMPVPFQLCWAPQGFTPVLATIHKDQVADFGYLVEPTSGEGQFARFTPALYAYPNDFRGGVGPGEAVRYHFDLVASNLTTSEQHTVIEVSWDGRWTTNPDDRRKSLVIRRIVA